MRNIILALLLILTSQQIEARPRAQDVWLEIRNATAFEEEFIRRDLARKARGIINFKRDNNFGFDKGVSYDGGIRIIFVDDDKDLFIESARKTLAYNIDLEQIEIYNIRINRATINLYQETNRFFAFINSITHGVMCHATTDDNGHTTWGLCRPDLSTDKVYWGKKHRRILGRNLALPGRTGEVLGETQLTRTKAEVSTLCEMGMMKKLELY